MSCKRKDYSEAVLMYEKGLSIGQIAEFYQISRQAMHKILKRREIVFRPKLRYGSENVFYRGGKKQCLRAHQLVCLAIEKGIIVPETKCSICSSEKNIEGHHDDYSKPLQVRWLCHKCHYEWHIENVPIENPSPEPTKSRKEICSLGGKASWAKRRKEK
jgi:ribosomal protein S27AE